MTTATATRSKPTTYRQVRVSPPSLAGARVLTMTLTTGSKVTAEEYWVVPNGASWRITKDVPGGKTYEVTLGTFRSCTCAGQRAYGHLHDCRHLAALAGLVKAGRI